MPWCPKCKNEYVEGITVCSDCGTPLVESLSDNKENIKKENDGMISILYGPKENVDGILEALHNSGISSAKLEAKKSDEEVDEPLFELFVAESDKEKTISIVQDILRAKQDLERREMIRQMKMEEAKKEKYETYVSSKDKAKEMRNSSVMLIVIAAIGYAFIALMITHVLPFGFGTGTSAIFCYCVLGGFFTMLLVFGIMSFSSGKRMSASSGEEEDLKKNVKEWMDETYTLEVINGIAKDTGDENQMYFARSEFMKRKLMMQFPDLKENLADELVEEKYGELYD